MNGDLVEQLFNELVSGGLPEDMASGFLMGMEMALAYPIWAKPFIDDWLTTDDTDAERTRAYLTQRALMEAVHA